MEIYPATPVPSWSQLIDDEFNVTVGEYDSGAEQRRMLLRFSRRTASSVYNNLIQSEIETLRSFIKKVHGPADSFWYIDFVKSKRYDEYLGRGISYLIYAAIADDGGVQTDETAGANNTTANDMTLLPPVPAVNDAYYFGFTVNLVDTIRVNIGTPGVGTWTIVWEYWNGASWTGLSNVVDGTTGFKAAAGNHDMNFDRPANWALTTVKTISAYWIRARVSAYTSVTTQPKGTQGWGYQRMWDLHGLTNTVGDLAVKIDGVTKTGGGTDYTFISGGGEANADRVRFNTPPAVGTLLTDDQNAFLRMKGHLLDNKISEELISVGIYKTSLKVKEVQW
jgi:hypothetical protein